MKICVFFLVGILSLVTYAEDRLIYVTDTVEKSFSPDYLELKFTISQVDMDMKDAKEAVDDRTRKIVSEIMALGVVKGDLVTSRMNIEKQFEDSYDDKVPPKYLGYGVSREFMLNLRNFSNLHRITQILVDGGVAGITSMDAKFSQEKKLELELAKEAAVKVKQHAQVLAEQVGAKLGPVVQLSQEKITKEWGEKDGRYEQVVVTARRKTGFSSFDVYEFQPEDVTLSSTIYAKFKLE